MYMLLRYSFSSIVLMANIFECLARLFIHFISWYNFKFRLMQNSYYSKTATMNDFFLCWWLIQIFSFFYSALLLFLILCVDLLILFILFLVSHYSMFALLYYAIRFVIALICKLFYIQYYRLNSHIHIKIEVIYPFHWSIKVESFEMFISNECY